MGGEHGLLLAEVLHANGQDGPVRRGLLAEPPQVCLAERAFPGEGLARDGPGPVAVPLAFGHVGQGQG